MNNKLKFLSILLAMLMILSSVAAVFAEGEKAPQTTDANTETDQIADENGTENPEGDGIENPEGDGTENPEGDGIENPEGDGTENPEADGTENPVVDGTENPEADEAENPEADEAETPEVPLATEADEETDVTVTINCVYEGEEEPFKTVKQECSFDDVIDAPTAVCAANPTPPTIKVEKQGDDNAKYTYTVKYTPVAPAKVTTLTLHPSYKSIIITWSSVPGATKYVLQRSKEKDKGFKTIKTITDATKKSYKYTDKKANGTVEPYSTARKYYYRVYAYSDRDKKSKSKTKSGTCVRPMYEEVYFKSSAQLTSHDGKHKTRTFHGGQKIVAQGFGGGKYRFYYKGNYFYANYVRVRNCKAKFQKNEDGIVGYARKNGKSGYKGKWAKQDYAKDGSMNYEGIKFYDKTTAENFVNKSKKSSKTKYLIWVSTYTQHLYIFKGKKGKWKLYKDWECSTGAAKSPTPTGFDKKIEDKWRNHSGIDYWSPFQHANSIHGQRSSYLFGKPQSNGCVRNFDQNAKWLYYNCARGTGLIVY